MAAGTNDDRTVRMSLDELPDPGATRRQSALDALPTTVASRADRIPSLEEAPTTVASRAGAIPSLEEGDAPEDASRVAPAPGRDGMDALDDPYFSPAAPEDLTRAHPIVSIESPVESLPERKRRMPRWAKVLLVLLAVLAAAGVAYLTYDAELWGGKTLPETVGMAEEDARAALEAAGFAVEVEYRAGDENVGVVFDMSPKAGVRAGTSDPVTLYVTGQRVVPEVVGLTEEEATQALYDAGAANVLVTRANSEEPEGTVLAVSPEQGVPFVSGDQITLTVAQPFTVPDVLGMTADEALAALEAQNILGNVTYVESDAESHVVVDANPSVGAQIEPGTTVELSVSSPFPSSPTHLVEYFDCSPEELASYLADEGFELLYGARYASSGNAHAVYEGDEGEVLHITNEPETGHYAEDSSGDVLADGAGVGGLRFAFSSQTLPEGAARESEEGIRAVMEACGFEGLTDTCTQDDIGVPMEVPEEYHFICATGRQGDYTWAIRIGGYGTQTGVIAMVAPTSHFSGLDLDLVGGSVCDYVAYIDLFTG